MPAGDAPAPPLVNVCVFCGSKPGSNPAFAAAAEALGKELLRRGLGLVYGGGDCGLMGIIARQVREGGGRVIGYILSGALSQDTVVVSNMHERKAAMAAAASCFIALPGGVGTLEGLMEMGTWWQLKMSSRPVGILNVASFYDGLLQQFKTMEREGFYSIPISDIFAVSDSASELLDRLEAIAASAPPPVRAPIG